MTVDAQDKELLDQIATSVDKMRALEVSQATSPWVNSSKALLESAYAEFKNMISTEHREEGEAHDAMSMMRATRDDLDMLFLDIVAVLDVALGKLTLAQTTSDDTKKAAQFLGRFHAGEFESLRDDRAISAVKYARRFLPLSDDDLQRTRLEDKIETAVQALEKARQDAVDEGGEAVVAYGELIDGRSIARVCYLTARDLLSAALRFEDRHDELDMYLPPMTEVITVGVRF